MAMFLCANSGDSAPTVRRPGSGELARGRSPRSASDGSGNVEDGDESQASDAVRPLAPFLILGGRGATIPLKDIVGGEEAAITAVVAQSAV